MEQPQQKKQKTEHPQESEENQRRVESIYEQIFGEEILTTILETFTTDDLVHSCHGVCQIFETVRNKELSKRKDLRLLIGRSHKEVVSQVVLASKFKQLHDHRLRVSGKSLYPLLRDVKNELFVTHFDCEHCATRLAQLMPNVTTLEVNILITDKSKVEPAYRAVGKLINSYGRDRPDKSLHSFTLRAIEQDCNKQTDPIKYPEFQLVDGIGEALIANFSKITSTDLAANTMVMFEVETVDSFADKDFAPSLAVLSRHVAHFRLSFKFIDHILSAIWDELKTQKPIGLKSIALNISDPTDRFRVHRIEQDLKSFLCEEDKLPLRERLIMIPFDLKFREKTRDPNPTFGQRFPALHCQTVLSNFSCDDFVSVVRDHPKLIQLVICTFKWQLVPAGLLLHRIGKNQSVLLLKLNWFMKGANAKSDFELPDCLPLLQCMPKLQYIDVCIQWYLMPSDHEEVIDRRFAEIRTFLREQARPLCSGLVGGKLSLENYDYMAHASTLVKEECFKLTDA